MQKLKIKTKFKSFRSIQDAVNFCYKLTNSGVRWFSGIRYSCYIEHNDCSYSCKKKMLFWHFPNSISFSYLRSRIPNMAYLTSYVVKYYEI